MERRAELLNQKRMENVRKENRAILYTRSRPRGFRRGAASNTCYVERQSFELSTSADVIWIIRESSVVRIWGVTSRAT